MSLVGKQLHSDFHSPKWLIVFTVTVVLLLIQYFSSFRPVWNLPYIKPNFFNYMLLFNYFGLGTPLYLLVFPFLAALIGGTAYSSEKLSGRLPLVLTRISKKRFVGSCLLSGFISGGLAGLTPLLINLVLAVIHQPHMEFVSGVMPSDPDAPYYPLIYERSWLYGFYEYSQILLLISVCVYIFAFSGLVAVLGVCCSFFTTHRYVEVMLPFVILLVIWFFTDVTNLWGISQVSYLDVRVGSDPLCMYGAVLLPLLLLALAYGLYKWGMDRHVA